MTDPEYCVCRSASLPSTETQVGPSCLEINWCPYGDG